MDKERIQPGDKVDVTLYWQALAPMRDNYSLYVQVFGWQQNLGQHDTYPGGGTYPVSYTHLDVYKRQGNYCGGLW